jgi:hypothetical protein
VLPDPIDSFLRFGHHSALHVAAVRTDYKAGEQIPLVIAGQTLPPIAVDDILP